jgi:hypothetical protein
MGYDEMDGPLSIACFDREELERNGVLWIVLDMWQGQRRFGQGCRHRSQEEDFGLLGR